MPPCSGFTLRWIQTLANNEFDVVHRLGRNQGNADALSRAPHLTEEPSLELDISMGEKIGTMLYALSRQRKLGRRSLSVKVKSKTKNSRR
jgi:hypothetical protein